MKLHSRILYALISISLPLFTTGAQADGYYAGIARGQSEFNSDISVSKGATIDNKSSVGQVFFGREFDNNVAVEAFYANLGKAKLSAKKGSTVSAGGKTVSVNEDTNVTGSTTSFGIAGKYYFDVHEGVRLSAKLGVHSWKSKYCLSSKIENFRSSDDGLDAMAGLGIEYAVSDKVAFMAGHDRFAVDDDDASITYLGVKFSFN